MEFSQALSKIHLGNTVLFLGSGYSIGAKSLDGSPILSSDGLRLSFLDIADIQDDRQDFDLKLAAQEAFGSDPVSALQYIRKSFICSRTSEDHNKIANYQWRRVYTTNYDTVFETASTNSKTACLSLTLSDNYSSTFNNNMNEVVHIHGLVTKLTEENFNREFVLTTDQYRNLRFSSTHWRKRLYDDFVYADSIIFVGFSAEDVHIVDILRSISFLKDRIFFVCSSILNKPTKLRMSEFGEYLNIGLHGLVEQLSLSIPLQVEEIRRPDCLYENVFGNIRDEISSTREQARDELLLGTLQESNFTGAISPGVTSAIYVDRISQRLGNRLEFHDGAIIVHSDVGNGKSVVVNHIAAVISKQGLKVFRFNGRSFDSSELIHFINSIGPAIYIVENISLNHHFAKIVKDNSIKSVILCTDRTKRLEVSLASVNTAIGQFIKIDYNKLTDSEIRDFVGFLDTNILWGDYSNLTNDFQKVNFIKEKCGSEVRGILFALFEGGSIKNRVERIFDDFDSLDRTYREIFILVCILNFAYTKNNLAGYLYNYEDFLDVRIDFHDFRNAISRGQIAEFLNEKGGYFEFKSSIFAKYYLNKRIGIEQVLDIVYRVLKNLENTFRFDDEPLYRDFSKALMQFNLYREIYTKNSAVDGRISLDPNQFSEKIDAFYDRCRHFRIARGDPLFVVQLSMAQMDREDYDECDSLIASAEAMCKPGFDQFHIQTHKAEVMIKRSIKHGLSEDLLREHEAFSLVKGVVERRNERYHPFGVMDLMIKTFNDRAATLSKIDKSKIKLIMQSIVLLAERFPSDIRDRYHIVSRVNLKARQLLQKL